MTTTILPPPFVEKYQYKPCQQINDPVTGKRVYATPDGEKLPSVTTILSATKSQESKEALQKWRDRVGEEQAKTITKEAAGRGTGMHGNLERFVAGMERQPGSNLVHVQAHKMADVIISNALAHVNEIWAMEQSLYYPKLYSGTTDLVAVYKGNPSICDYKQSNKPKKAEWVEDYYYQLMAYMLAHNEVYGSDIREGHIFMCTGDLVYQQFDIWPDDFAKYEDLWMKKLENYYLNHHTF